MSSTQLPKFPIPDVRFSNVFYKALTKETEKQKLVNPNLKVVVKVLVRDVILMPFIQSILWTGFIISVRPSVKHLISVGKSFKSSVYNMIIGSDLTNKKQI
ncbi:hypothetical protein C6P45_000165 [Maudiozyma exigua]|uniref:Uncharacterized protein n=1 Tax=Maudiozyma exigua TaxID=34358 RepID=A0A9P7BAD5_MAUEX|nr:hypothetical protein C6P45_000165 [Kazachstania exigua]